MRLICQLSALDELKQLAERNRHSVLIEGVRGCGKTYLAYQYAKMLDISDFAVINPTVNDIRKAVDSSYNLESPIVFCIENLDSGVVAASYTLLKFLEEPRDNVYIVVTCCNINRIPDTIISRSSVVTVTTPTDRDLNDFLQSYPEDKRIQLLDRSHIWRSVKSLPDVDYCMNLITQHIGYCDYLEDLLDLLVSRKPISDILWSLGHYPDQSEIPVSFLLRFIISNTSDKKIQKYGIECIKDLDSSRIASHAVLSKFIMECKYGD